METLTISLQLIQYHLGNPAADGALKNVKIVFPLKHLSSFWRSLEMSLINCKIHLELSWTKDCVMCNVAADTTFKKTITNLCVPIVILSIKDKVKLTKHLNEGIKRPSYCKEYKNTIESKEADDNLTRFYLDDSFQGTKRLFVLAFDNTDDSEKNVERNCHRKKNFFKSKYNQLQCIN